jgi:hypothetical protein
MAWNVTGSPLLTSRPIAASSDLFFGFAAGGSLQDVDALLAGVVHETRLW